MFFFANYILLQCDIQPFAEYAVAPHVGAWIETGGWIGSAISAGSHPMWVRGLKHIDPQKAAEIQAVAPHVGAWIETSFESVCYSDNESHPMWVRGLKLHHLLQLLLLLIRRTPCGCVD